MRLVQCARCSKGSMALWWLKGLPALSAASDHAEMAVEEEAKMSWANDGSWGRLKSCLPQI